LRAQPAWLGSDQRKDLTSAVIELNVFAAMSNERAPNIDPNDPLAFINAIAEGASEAVPGPLLRMRDV
jgi:hypothetical protein